MVCGTWETATFFLQKIKVVPVRFYFGLWLLIVCGHTEVFLSYLLVWTLKLDVCQACPGVPMCPGRFSSWQWGTAARTVNVLLFKAENASSVLVVFPRHPLIPCFITYCLYFPLLNKCHFFYLSISQNWELLGRAFCTWVGNGSGVAAGCSCGFDKERVLLQGDRNRQVPHTEHIYLSGAFSNSD